MRRERWRARIAGELDFTTFQGVDAEVELASSLQARHLFTGKRSPRLRQRQNKAMRKAGVSWADIDAAFRASTSLKWHYTIEVLRELTYDRSPFLSMLEAPR